MAGPLGWFDRRSALDGAWFDASQFPVGWFDDEQVDQASAPAVSFGVTASSETSTDQILVERFVVSTTGSVESFGDVTVVGRIGFAASASSENSGTQTLVERFSLSTATGTEDAGDTSLAERYDAPVLASSEDFADNGLTTTNPPISLAVDAQSETATDAAIGVPNESVGGTFFGPILRSAGRRIQRFFPAEVSFNIEASTETGGDVLASTKSRSVGLSVEASSETSGDSHYVIADIIPSVEPDRIAPSIRPSRQKPLGSPRPSERLAVAIEPDRPRESQPAPIAIIPVTLSLIVNSGSESGSDSSFTVAGQKPRTRPAYIPAGEPWTPEIEDADDIALIAMLYAMVA